MLPFCLFLFPWVYCVRRSVYVSFSCLSISVSLSRSLCPLVCLSSFLDYIIITGLEMGSEGLPFFLPSCPFTVPLPTPAPFPPSTPLHPHVHPQKLLSHSCFSFPDYVVFGALCWRWRYCAVLSIIFTVFHFPCAVFPFCVVGSC